MGQIPLIQPLNHPIQSYCHQSFHHVTGYEKIEYGFTFIDGIFGPSNTNLADCYKKWGRCPNCHRPEHLQCLWQADGGLLPASRPRVENSQDQNWREGYDDANTVEHC